MQYRIELKVIAIDRDEIEEEIYAGQVPTIDDLLVRANFLDHLIQIHSEAQNGYNEWLEEHLEEDRMRELKENEADDAYKQEREQHDLDNSK